MSVLDLNTVKPKLLLDMLKRNERSINNIEIERILLYLTKEITVNL